MTLNPGTRLGAYEILALLGTGGMGEVYPAHQEHHGAPRLCVVKTVRAEYAHDRVATRRFVDEARTSALLAHRNIVAVYDVGEDGGRPYIAVEYVPGRDLMAIFVAANEAGAPVPEAIGLAIALAVSRVLRNQIRNISTNDPLTIVLVIAVVAGAGIAACWFPARRATRVDPLIALRYE